MANIHEILNFMQQKKTSKLNQLTGWLVELLVFSVKLAENQVNFISFLVDSTNFSS